MLADRRVRQLTTLARTTPVVLTELALALIVIGLLAGVFTALGVQSRAQAVDDLAVRSGPLSVAAEEIYRSLSDADATATGAFLSGGLEPATARQRYEADIAQASGALAVAVAAHDPADITARNSALATLSEQLPVYTGLVETARADNRQGLPLGAAYQREASNLMRARLLPAAQDLYLAESAQVNADQNSAGALPVAELLLALIVLGALVTGQVLLRRRTNRIFNAGLLAATAAAVVSLLWVAVASVAVMANIHASRSDGSAQVEVLAKARIATLSARADETLTLVARGAGQQYQADYEQVSKQLGDLLNSAGSLATDDAVRAKIDAAKQGAATWASVHAKVRAADDGGDYGTAVGLVTDQTSAQGAGTAFDNLDKDLRDAINQTRSAFDRAVAGANSALTGTIVGVAVLALVVAGGSAAGIWRRLKDYR